MKLSFLIFIKNYVQYIDSTPTCIIAQLYGFMHIIQFGFHLQSLQKRNELIIFSKCRSQSNTLFGRLHILRVADIYGKAE